MCAVGHEWRDHTPGRIFFYMPHIHKPATVKYIMIMSTVNTIYLVTELSTSFHITQLHSRDITSYFKPEHYNESFRRVSGYRWYFQYLFQSAQVHKPNVPWRWKQQAHPKCKQLLPFNTVSIPEKLSHLHQHCCENLKSQTLYSTIHGLWPVDGLTGLVDGPTWYDEVPRGGRLELQCDKVNCTYGSREKD